MRRNLPSVSVILYQSKTLANGEYPITLRVSYNGKRSYRSLGLSCSEKMWNENKSEVRASHKMALQMNGIIRNEIDKVNKYILSIEGKEDYSAKSIIEATYKVAPSTHTLYSLAEERIQYFKEVTKKLNTASGYRTLLNIIKKFTENEDVELFNVNKAWARDLEGYMRTKYADNSIRKFFDCLKALFNYAVDKEYIKESPLNSYKFIKELDCHTRKKALTIAEITTLMQYYYDAYGMIGIERNVDVVNSKKKYWNQKFKPKGTTKLTPCDAEQLSLALFLTSYLFQGLALVDIAKLRRKDLKIVKILNKEKWIEDSASHGTDYANEHAEYSEHYEIYTRREKTNHDTRILAECSTLMPYLNPFGSFVDGSETEEELEEYLFPIYDKDNNDSNAMFGRMKYAIYLVNVNLKRITKKLGMGTDITFYSARHSYASILYHGNIPVGLIAQNMGRNPNEIQTYLKDFDTDNIIKANQKALIVGQEGYMNLYEEAKRKKRREKRKIEE